MISLFDFDTWPARPEPKIRLSLDVSILWGEPVKITIRTEQLPALHVTGEFTAKADAACFCDLLSFRLVKAINAIVAPRQCSPDDENDIAARVRAGLLHRLAPADH
jgi:hypothetical protein